MTELFAELASCDPGDPRGAALRDQIVALTLPLARNIARRFSSRGEEMDDLYQVACVGLIHAVDRFDPARGSGFTSFAVPTIMGEVRRYFRDHAWAARVPRRVKDLSLDVGKATEALSHRLGRSPTAAELAAELDTDPDSVIEAIAAAGAYQTHSLDSPVVRDGDTDATLADTLAADDNELEKSELHLALRPLIEKLSPREKRIVKMRFFEERTQTEIARELGVSQVQVSRLLSKILARIRTDLDG
ncbi:RNA polymerase sigma factor SigF [Rhodococcus sp. SGAir0479]|uniref:RNA polymerase sigma factor SigF n=1 Tax=Rhodococcus sp. SGAir0479 TaxID=2567884 RepID=UPI0020C7B92B|nr:RNA polymerase sigma factor SigF [Rhodococcus sp. SGAir0479]